jgi:hypothetical protein
VKIITFQLSLFCKNYRFSKKKAIISCSTLKINLVFLRTHACIILYIFQSFCFFVNIQIIPPAHTVAWQTNTPTATCLLSAAKVFNITPLEQDVHEQVQNGANKNEEKANNGIDAVHIDAVKRIHTEVNRRGRSDISVASRHVDNH